jgi:Uma2 family endonuclease
MTLAPPAPHPDALAPLLLPADLRLSPEQFAAVCIANPQAVLELTAEGHLIHMPPTGGETGARNSRLLMRLFAWADGVGGWQVFDSSTGFRLPDGSVLSPDASLVRLERWQALNPEFPTPLPRSAGRTRQPQRRRPPWPHRLALQDGRLPGQWRPTGLAADPRAGGCRDLEQ